MARVIFHVDVNSAFLSWSALEALAKDPGSVDLRTIPSAVGGDVKTRHGVITARSIPAKKYGVKTGEPVVNALQKCPTLVLVPSDFTAYRRNSRALMELLRTYSPILEQLSIDEAFLDMTDALGTFPGKNEEEKALEAAKAIREQVKADLHFTVNVGISRNRLLAKTASDFTKPDKTHTLYPEEVPAKLWPLPIGDLYGCGAATASRLNSFGIRTIEDAAKADPELLRRLLGDKSGTYIHESANGHSSDRIRPERDKAKSYSNETTTSLDITADNYAAEALPILAKLSGQVARRMQKDRVRAQTIGVLVKTTDFRRRSKQTALPDPTNDEARIRDTVQALFEDLMTGSSGLFSRGVGLRLLGVQASSLTEEGGFEQLSLFDLPPREAPAAPPKKKKDPRKKQALDSMLGAINSRYGSGTVVQASRITPKERP